MTRARNSDSARGRKGDFVLTKETSIGEQLHLQFRSEFFNLLNRANFGASVTRLFADAAGARNPTVGRITTSSAPRQVQFGLRLAFRTADAIR